MMQRQMLLPKSGTPSKTERFSMATCLMAAGRRCGGEDSADMSGNPNIEAAQRREQAVLSVPDT